MDEFKGDYSIPPISEPDSDSAEYKVITKLSDGVKDPEAFHWYFNHTFGRKWKMVLTSEAIVYMIWNEGDVPIPMCKKRGCQKNYLKGKDLQEYKALEAKQEAKRQAKKAKTA